MPDPDAGLSCIFIRVQSTRIVSNLEKKQWNFYLLIPLRGPTCNLCCIYLSGNIVNVKYIKH